MTTFQVDAAGVDFVEAWRTVSGATEVKVTAATLRLNAASSNASKSIGTISGAHDNVDDLVLTIPGGERSLRSIKLNGFSRRNEDDDTIQIRSQGDIDGRIAIALPDPATNQRGAPVHTVPRVPRNNEVPPQLGGASFSDRTLRLPNLRAAKVHITRVHNSRPDEFERQPFSVSSVSGTIAPHPEQLTLAGPDGAELFSLPGPFTGSGGSLDIDIRTPLQMALAAKLTADEPLTAGFELTAGVDGEVRSPGIASAGRIKRVETQPVVAELDGGAVPVHIAGAPLDVRRPHSVTADVSVTYHGLVRHVLSDTVPPEMGGLAGSVVGADPVLRRLPPQALRGEHIARLGVVGRAVGATDLSIRVVSMTGDSVGLPLGDPGTASLPAPDDDATAEPATIWFDLPDPIIVDGPVGVTLSATRGGFRWVGPTNPLLLIVVHEPDPAGRTVRIGSASLSITEDKETFFAVNLNRAEFTAREPGNDLLVDSRLFTTVQMDNLTLEYTP